MKLRFKRIRQSQAPDPLLPVLNQRRWRETQAQERTVQLMEWELLHSIVLLDRSEAQKRRYMELTQLLWPPPEPNPIVGIRRVRGGHKYPIPDYGTTRGSGTA